MSLHETCQDGSIKEIHKASGGSWGGCRVDQSFLTWMTQLVGQTAMGKFKSMFIGDYFDLIREFETKKRNIFSNSGPVTLNVPVSIIQLNRENERSSIQQNILDLGFQLSVKFLSRANKLRVDTAIAQTWFTEPIQGIVRHLRSILCSYELLRVDAILIVGGFGECKPVQEAIRSHFPDQRIIVPDESGLAVLRGAVLFGYMSGIIRSRKMRYTYGIATRQNSGCFRDSFEIFVSVGADVEVGGYISKTFWPISSTDTGINIYASPRADPEYVDEDDCIEIGSITIDHSEGRTIDDKKFNVQFYFGQTEIQVLVKILRTGRKFKGRVDFL